MKVSTKELNSRKSYRQRGLAIVEFTIVLPLLLLLMLATAELGRALYQQDTLNKAVRDGARHLAGTARLGTGTVLDSAAFTVARNRVLCGSDSCASTAPLLPNMVITDVDATAPDGNNVVVTARYRYQPMLGAVLRPFGWGTDIPLDFTITATSAMRIL
jgi:Flp pilus assembly protein TadG